MLEYRPVVVKVWGEYACFTRPEMKAERVSYPVMPPSAARGLLEAIFWKPEIQWQIRDIWVLKPIRHFSIVRNEVTARAVFSTARKGVPFYSEDHGTQRHTLALKDVAYVIRAAMVPARSSKHSLSAYRRIFERRLHKGQYFHHPCLGCREFAAHFAAPNGDERPIQVDQDLGVMLFDLDYTQAACAVPRFFRAKLKGGVLHVPSGLYEMEKA